MSESVETLMGYYAKRRIDGCAAEPGYIYRLVNGGTVVLSLIETSTKALDMDPETDNYGKKIDVVTSYISGCIIQHGDLSLFTGDLAEAPNGFEYTEDGIPTVANQVINYFAFALAKKLTLAEVLEEGVLNYELPSG